MQVRLQEGQGRGEKNQETDVKQRIYLFSEPKKEGGNPHLSATVYGRETRSRDAFAIGRREKTREGEKKKGRNTITLPSLSKGAYNGTNSTVDGRNLLQVTAQGRRLATSSNKGILRTQEEQSNGLQVGKR